MFFFTYLAKELRRRLRQAIFIALGLAVGVGLVLTVTAASTGVKNAEAGVLKGLYGVGTDVTVSGAAPSAQSPSKAGGGTIVQIQLGPNGAQMCVNGKCHSLKDGYTIDNLSSPSSRPSAARRSRRSPRSAMSPRSPAGRCSPTTRPRSRRTRHRPHRSR